MSASHITFQKLQIFCTIAEFRSVTRAAEHIGVSQPVVTAHIRSLETKLGVKLFARTGRNIILTEAGERILRWANDALRQAQEMERDIDGFVGGASGRVAVSASLAVGSYVLPGILLNFHAAYPDARVTAVISNLNVATEAVRIGACDLALLIVDPRQNLDDLIVELHWEERMILVAASKSRLVGERATAKELESVPFFSSPKGFVFRDVEDEKLRSCGILKRNVIFELGHPEAQRRMICADAGVGFMLQTTVQDSIARGELRIVETPRINISVQLALVYRRNKTFSPLQSRFLDFLRKTRPPGLRALA